MLLFSKAYRGAFFGALLLHLVLGLVLWVKAVHRPSQLKAMPASAATVRPDEPVIQAAAVDAQAVAAELKRIQDRKARREAQAVQKRLRAEQHLAALQREAHKVIQQRAIQQKKLKHAQQDLRAAEKHLEALRADARKKMQLAEQRKVAEHRLQQKLAREEAEQARLAKAAQELQADRKRLQGYRDLVLQVIARHWLVPQGISPTLSCTLLVRVLPGGRVQDVRLVRSSGNLALDRSARTAVFKASPLPVPKEARLFKQFQSLRLTVRPQDIRNGERIS